MELSLFNYRRGNSILHKANAGAKIFFLFAFSFFVFWGKAPERASEIFTKTIIIRTAAAFFTSAILFLLAGANFKSLKALRFVLFIGIFFTILKMIGSPIDGLASGLLYTIRFFASAWAAQTIYETTSMVQIQEALRLPLVVSLALNFLPQIFFEWEKINLAARARVPSKAKKSFAKNFYIKLYELQTLLFVMIEKAERVRKAVSNRQ